MNIGLLILKPCKCQHIMLDEDIYKVEKGKSKGKYMIFCPKCLDAVKPQNTVFDAVVEWNKKGD